LNTLLLISPLVLICVIGYLSVRLKLVNQQQSNVLAQICFSVLIPLFLFKSTYQANLSDSISLPWFASFYVPVVFVFLAGYWVNVTFFKKTQKAATIRALVGSYSNTVLVAIPILSTILPVETAAQAFVIIGFHSAVLFTLTEILLYGKGLSALLSGIKNPIVLSIFSGLFCNLIGLPIPQLIMDPIALLSQSAIALALFGLGASMNFMPIKGNRFTAISLSTTKLMVLPAAVLLFANQFLHLSQEQALISVMLTASPTGAACYLLANQHKESVDVAATTVVLSTALCPLSYWFWIEYLL